MRHSGYNYLQADERIPLGAAWASSSVNCCPFRRHGVLTHEGSRWCAFYNELGNVSLLRWPDISKAEVEYVELPCPRPPHDAHNSISLGVDQQKRTHIAFGAHASSLFYARSNGKSFIDGFTPVTDFEPSTERHYTYPMFLNIGADQEFIFLYRNGTSSSAAIEICRWDSKQEIFVRDPTALLDGSTSDPWRAGPYLNDPIVDQIGTVAIFYMWRLPAQVIGRDSVVLNRGIEFLSSTDGLRTVSNGDVDLTKPITPVTSAPCITVKYGASLINQAGACFRPDGVPMMATYWDLGDGIPQYQLIWRSDNIWHRRQISKFQTRFSLNGSGTLPLPHSRPVIAASLDGSIYCLCRSTEFGNRLVIFAASPPDYDFSRTMPVLLCDEDLGFYEPVIDRGAWETSKELLLYIQACAQIEGDGSNSARSAVAAVYRWSPDQIKGILKPRYQSKLPLLRIFGTR